MSLINLIDIDTRSGYRSFELHHADITNLTFQVDAIALSAGFKDYVPIPGTIIKALDDRGVGLERLSWNPHLDFRDAFGAWVADCEGANLDFQYLLCLEILGTGFTYAEAIKNLFTVLSICEMKGLVIKKLALPMLGAGVQKINTEEVITTMLKESVDFLEHARFLEKIIFVAYTPEDAATLNAEMNKVLGRSQVLIPKGDNMQQHKQHIKQEIRLLREIGLDDESFSNICDALRSEEATAYHYGSTSRKVLEYTINNTVKPELHVSLFKKISILNQSNIAKWYIQYFHLVREFGNMTVHANSRDNKIPTYLETADVEICLHALGRILTFFRKVRQGEYKI